MKTSRTLVILLVLMNLSGCGYKTSYESKSVKWQDSLYTAVGWDTLKEVFVSQGTITEEEKYIIEEYLLPMDFYYTYSTLINKAIQMNNDAFRKDCDNIDISFPYGFGETPVIKDIVRFFSNPDIIMSPDYTGNDHYYERLEKLKKEYKSKSFSYYYDNEDDVFLVNNHDDYWSFKKKGDDMHIFMKYKTFGDSIYEMDLSYETDLATLLKLKYGEPQVFDSSNVYTNKYIYGWNFKNIFLRCTYFPSEDSHTESTDYSKFFSTGRLSDIKTTHHYGQTIPRTYITYTNKALKERKTIYKAQIREYGKKREMKEREERQIQLELERQKRIQDSIEHLQLIMNDL